MSSSGGISQKPSFVALLDAVSERVGSDTTVELLDQCRANPSVIRKFVRMAAVLESMLNLAETSDDRSSPR